MSKLGRFTKLFTTTKTVTGNRAFDYYYGSVLQDQPDGGLNAGQARHDFDKTRQTIFWVRTYQ